MPKFNHHNNLDCCKSELARSNGLMAEMKRQHEVELEEIKHRQKSVDAASQMLLDEFRRLEDENAKLKTALSGQTCFVPPEFEKELDEVKGQLAAANKRDAELAASQAPIAWICKLGDDVISASASRINGLDWKPLYADPIIPPEVAELQAQLAKKQNELARQLCAHVETCGELERYKLLSVEHILLNVVPDLDGNPVEICAKLSAAQTEGENHE